MKKLKTSLIALTKISLICLAFFVFSPSLKAYAIFSDTTSINMGIQLELGTVSMATEDTIISNDVNYTEGDPVLFASSTLINDGSLPGKLAYKIGVTKEDGTLLTAEEIKDMSVIVNFGTVAKEVMASAVFLNTNGFTFVKNNSGSDVIVEPDSVGEVPVEIKYETSSPTKDEKLKVTVTFRLIQSNAADANAEIFSDEETLANTVTLVPKVIEEKNYWPKENTFIKTKDGKLSYNIERMNMVFSEVYDKDNPKIKQIRNLNKAVLYIQIPRNEELETIDKKTGQLIDSFKVTSLVVDDVGKIKYEPIEIDEGNHGIKITFNLEDSYDSSNSNKVKEYTNKYRYPINIRLQLGKYTSYGQNNSSYEYYSGVYYQKDIFASRLVLTSDIPSEVKEAKFEQRNILLSKTEKSIEINQIKTLSYDSVKNEEFEDVQLTNEKVVLEVTGNKLEHIKYSLVPNNKISLWLKSNGNIDGAALNVKITGDTGNTLVIHRKLENKFKSNLQFKSTSISSASASLADEPAEQAIDTEKSVEVPDSSIDKTTPDEQAVDSSIEESDTEQVTDEAELVEETKEAVDSSSVESAAESIEESDQSAPVEPINNE